MWRTRGKKVPERKAVRECLTVWCWLVEEALLSCPVKRGGSRQRESAKTVSRADVHVALEVREGCQPSQGPRTSRGTVYPGEFITGQKWF